VDNQAGPSSCFALNWKASAGSAGGPRTRLSAHLAFATEGDVGGRCVIDRFSARDCCSG
jgi:hypothetical protein